MDERTSFLILSLEGESFAVPLTSLVEITVPRSLPRDPALSVRVEGKVEYRGREIPVVNLKKLLQMPGDPGGSLIVVKSAKGVLGLLVDAAQEILESVQKPAQLPQGLMDPHQEYYAGILRNREDLVLILNENSLLP
jgi:chemotaxis signal transduction protein